MSNSKIKGNNFISTHNINDVLRNFTRAIIIDSGKKIFDGSEKEGVEKYKKMIVGLSTEEKKESTKNEKNKELENDTELWKTRFQENPNLIEYEMVILK